MITHVTHDTDQKPLVKTIKYLESRHRGDLLVVFTDGTQDILHRGKYVPGQLQPGDKITVHDGLATKV